MLLRQALKDFDGSLNALPFTKDNFRKTLAQGPMRIDARMEVIKKRALELKGFLDLIQEG